MKINHDKTKGYILSICDLLKCQTKAAKEFKAEKEKVLTDNMLSEEYKNNCVAALRENYIAKYKETKVAIVKKLEAIILAEKENESILEYDVPEFSNTLAAINSAKGNLPSNVIESIKLNFAGQYQALLTIQAAFERYGVNLKDYKFNIYTTVAETAVNALIIQAENIELSEMSAFISLKKLYDNVISFGEIRGIVFTDEQKEYPFSDEVRTEILKKSMRLS